MCVLCVCVCVCVWVRARVYQGVYIMHVYRLRFKRCIRRYHRAIFIWYLSLVLNNIIVLFGFLFVDADELQRSKEACGLGYKHWFQNEMGNSLIDEINCLHRSAVKVVSFMRFVLAKALVNRTKADRRTSQVDDLHIHHSFIYEHTHSYIHIQTHNFSPLACCVITTTP